MVKECISMIPVLIGLIVMNIVAGTVNSIAIEKIKFDKARMVEGLVKAVIAVLAVIILAYAFETIDLSALGFTPITIVSTGIIVYAGKLGKNLIKILGLDSYIKAKTKDDQTVYTENDSNDSVG